MLRNIATARHIAILDIIKAPTSASAAENENQSTSCLYLTLLTRSHACHLKTVPSVTPRNHQLPSI